MLLTTLLLVAFSSCGVSNKVSTFKPYESRNYSQMNDLVACGDTEIEIEYSSYLFGLFHNIETVNGEQYVSQNITKVHVPRSGVHGLLNKALYKAMVEHPEACYFQLIKSESSTDRLFLGSIVKKKATIRAYRFK